jgi:hypothetical protein
VQDDVLLYWTENKLFYFNFKRRYYFFWFLDCILRVYILWDHLQGLLIREAERPLVAEPPAAAVHIIIAADNRVGIRHEGERRGLAAAAARDHPVPGAPPPAPSALKFQLRLFLETGAMVVVMVVGVGESVVGKVPAQEVGLPLRVPILAARSGPVSAQGEKRVKLPHSALIKNFPLIYKEIQSGAVYMTYMTKGFIIYEEMREYFPYMRRPLVIYDFSTAPL